MNKLKFRLTCWWNSICPKHMTYLRCLDGQKYCFLCKTEEQDALEFKSPYEKKMDFLDKVKKLKELV